MHLPSLTIARMRRQCTIALLTRSVSRGVQVKARAREMDAELETEERKMKENGTPCEDENELCGGWAGSGECSKNAGFMMHACQKSCGQCHPRQATPPK